MKLDRALSIAAVVLAVVVVGFAAYFGYTVYQDRLAAEEASPAGRIAKVIAEEVKKNPNDAVLRVRYGEALAAAGKAQDAVKQFNAALKIDPKHTGAMMDLGQLALNSEELDTASGYYQKVVDLTSGSTMEDVNQRREAALYQLGRIALAQQEFERAIGFFKGALRIRRDASDTYYLLARSLDGVGDSDGAIDQLKIAVEFDRNFAEAHYFLGDLYYDKGDEVLASYHYSRAVQSAPNEPAPEEALAKLGTVEERLAAAKSQLAAGEIDGSLENARIARNIDPENVAAALAVAVALEAKKDYVTALATYKEAQKLAPDDAAIKASIERVTKLQPKPKGKRKRKRD